MFGESYGHRTRLPCPRPLPFLWLAEPWPGQLLTPWSRHRVGVRSTMKWLQVARERLSDQQLAEVALIEAVLWAAASTGRLPSVAWVGQDGSVTGFRPDRSWLRRKFADYLGVNVVQPVRASVPGRQPVRAPES
jgi:hypothetical protein